MKLGLATGYWSSGPPPGIQDSIAEAERLGFDSIWTAEAYGSDAFTPLAWWGSQTSRIKLGTAIAQLSARTPAATAMAAMTLDHLSGGRFILGIGASGPQVVEGWYGQPYPRPLERTREYVEIVRRIFARDRPVEFSGRHYQLPYAGGTGLGKPLKSTVHPLRTDIPIYLGAEGPKNVAMAAIPRSLIEDTSLIGPMDKIKDDLARWKETLATTFLVGGPPKFLDTVAKAVL